MSTTIALILRALSTLLSMGVLGKSPSAFAPVISTLASLAEVPDFTKVQQAQLLQMVETWVNEKRAPTDAELDSLKSSRDTMDAALRNALAKLLMPAAVAAPAAK